MSLYDRLILPFLIHGAMGLRHLAPYRAEIGQAAQGAVLEIGIGSGRNLPFYGRSVSTLTGIEPNDRLRTMAERAAGRAGRAVTLLPAHAESLPFPNHNFDCVVTSFTLCSVSDPARSLAEMRRVLKPAGCLLFVEHGLAPEPGVRRWQARLNPLQRCLGGGCHLDRPMDRLITDAGFAFAQLRTGYMRGPKFASFLYAGTARPEPVPQAQ